MLKFAITGCGGHARHHHVPLFKRMSGEVEIVALCDTAPAKSAAFKSEFYPKAAEFTDHDAMLKSMAGELDGVLIATPHTTHFQQCKNALEAGVNVLVEKPMVTSSADAYALWETMNRTGKKLAIAFQAPYCAEYQWIKQQRDAGKLGKPQLIQGWLAQGWAKPGSWRHDPKLSGGGQLYDSGAHVLNGMMWIMNEPVVEVGAFYDKLGNAVDINGVLIMKFQSGALGSVAIGGNSPGWNVDIKLQTDRLQLRTGPHGGYLEVTGDVAMKYPAVKSDGIGAAFTANQNFVDAINGKAELQATARHGALLSALMDALYESADTQMLVKVKPVPDKL